MDSKRLGYVFTLLAIVIFSLQDAISKHLGSVYPPVFIAMLRFWAFGAFAIALGMRGPGELLVDTSPGRFVLAAVGPTWTGPGAPAPIALDVPQATALLGISGFAQGLLLDAGAPAGSRVGLTDAVEIRVGL